MEPKQQLDLGFKEGETIKINMKITKKDGSDVGGRGVGAKKAGGLGLLPPPPGGSSTRIVPPPSVPSPSHQPAAGSAAAAGGTEWGEFTSAGDKPQATTPSKTNANWVQF